MTVNQRVSITFSVGLMILCFAGSLRGAEVKRMIDIGKPGGHFLFGTGVMPLAVPEANIRAMLDASFEYGRLP